VPIGPLAAGAKAAQANGKIHMIDVYYSSKSREYFTGG